MKPIVWPDGKKFAFTFFDDTDHCWMTNTRPVYDFLADLGILGTKTFWMLPPDETPQIPGLDCTDPAYLAWAHSLLARGFEHGYHGARNHTSPRADNLRCLDLQRQHFGTDPICGANHFQNQDSIYWGAARLSGWRRLVYQAATAFRPRSGHGHLDGHPQFWGDLCRDRIRYYRNFVFRDINTLAACPIMPYHDPERPYVNAWFASAEAGHLGTFKTLLHEANQDRLAEQGGACIVYTHFAKGFSTGTTLDRRFVELMKRLASLGGWFVPCGKLLDYISEKNGGIHTITAPERADLERRWLAAKLIHGSS